MREKANTTHSSFAIFLGRCGVTAEIMSKGMEGFSISFSDGRAALTGKPSGT